MQAITTTYRGPTNVQGSRIIARCAGGRVTVSYDYALNLDENHVAAARALIKKLKWEIGPWVSGTQHDGRQVHVANFYAAWTP